MFLISHGPRSSNAQRQLVSDLIVYASRKADTARFRHRLKPHADVDAIAVEVTAFDYHVAQVDADAQYDAVVLAIPSFAIAMHFCNSTAQATALTALANSTSTPSPMTLTTRP